MASADIYISRAGAGRLAQRGNLMGRKIWPTMALLTLLLGDGRARASPQQCTQFATTVTTQFVVERCNSPVGVCTVGTIADGPLEGTTAFTATAARVNGVVQHFEGIFVVTTDDGTITYFTFGSVNLITGSFQEQFKVVSGTGAFEDAKGTLVSHGQVLEAGFEGSLNGVICVDREPERIAKR